MCINKILKFYFMKIGIIIKNKEKYIRIVLSFNYIYTISRTRYDYCFEYNYLIYHSNKQIYFSIQKPFMLFPHIKNFSDQNNNSHILFTQVQNENQMPLYQCCPTNPTVRIKITYTSKLVQSMYDYASCNLLKTKTSKL